MKMFRVFHRAPDFLLMLGDAIDDRDNWSCGKSRPASSVIAEEYAQFVSLKNSLAEARADFVGI